MGNRQGIGIGLGNCIGNRYRQVSFSKNASENSKLKKKNRMITH